LIATLLATALFAQAPAAPPAKPVRPDGLYATINVTMGGVPMGQIVFKFFEAESPIGTKNFVDLAEGRKEWTDPKTKSRVRRRFYDGLLFHRVIPGFMIQGGDASGTGSGSASANIRDEYTNGLIFDQPGRVAWASLGSPNTASSQFFITEGPRPSLDGGYTIFGQVVEGQDVVARVAGVPRNAQDRPNLEVKMAKVTIERVGAPPAAAAKPIAPVKPASAPKPAAKQ
jgi:cyclophilin family peptidyl-prolyl cis-trans isomerase